MSSNKSSAIFESFTSFFHQYSPKNITIKVSLNPIEGARVYHYHRPNFEEKLQRNSIVTVHHDLEDNNPLINHSDFINRYKEANKVVCLNKRQIHYLSFNYKIENTELIPHGVDITNLFYRKKEFDPTRKFIIGIISKRYDRRVKGEAYLYEILKRIDRNKIEFMFVGEGRVKESIICEYFDFQNTFYEDLSYSLYPEIYSKIDLLLVPSLFEGGPANIPEAIFSGVPILGRNIAMISDYLIDGFNGFFLSGNFDEDAVLINNIASNKNNLYSNMIENIHNSERPCLSWEQVVKKYVDIYEVISKYRRSNL